MSTRTQAAKFKPDSDTRVLFSKHGGLSACLMAQERTVGNTQSSFVCLGIFFIRIDFPFSQKRGNIMTLMHVTNMLNNVVLISERFSQKLKTRYIVSLDFLKTTLLRGTGKPTFIIYFQPLMKRS